jgi:hypothetical protein
MHAIYSGAYGDTAPLSFDSCSSEGSSAIVLLLIPPLLLLLSVLSTETDHIYDRKSPSMNLFVI